MSTHTEKPDANTDPSRPSTRHPALARLVERRRGGQDLRALLGFERLFDEIGAKTESSLDAQQLSAAAAAEAARSAFQCGLPERAVRVLSDSAQRFEAPIWQQVRERTQNHYQQLVHLAVRLGQDQKALDLFAQARGNIQLSAALRRDLARAASRTSRTDLASAQLYLDHLADSAVDDEDRPVIIALLRRALLVNLIAPDSEETEARRPLNERLWTMDRLPWVAGNLVAIALRAGRRSDALRIRDEVEDLVGADAETLLVLSAAATLGRRWTDARELVLQAADTEGDSDLHRCYEPLSRLNLLLAGMENISDRDTFRRRLETEASALALALPGDESALDAHWVLGTAWTLLGRYADALSAFRRGVARYVSCRHALSELHALSRHGEDVAGLLGQLQSPGLDVGPLVRLLVGRAALDRLDLPAVRNILGSVSSPSTDPDPDLPAIRDCLKFELALTDVSSDLPLPAATESPDEVSAPVRAWLARLQCRWHLQRGNFEPAREILLHPLQFLAPIEETQRLEAARRALAGEDGETIDGLFAELARGPTAPPIDRLTHGLWLCGRRREPEARTVLEPLVETLSDSPEFRLAQAQIELAEGGSPDRARGLLKRFCTERGAPDRAAWINGPSLSVFRPWLRRLPPELWDQKAAVSMGRVGDILHGAELMIQAGLTTEALATLLLAEELLGKALPSAAEPVGRLYARAARIALEEGRFDEACRLHARAEALNHRDLDFMPHLAAALPADVGASDDVLRGFLEWVAAFTGDEAALDGTTVAERLRRLLTIRETDPVGAAEVNRRRTWTENAASARPVWDWPKRNLAHDAARSRQPKNVVKWIEALTSRQPGDHFLEGRARWDLKDFDAAFKAFTNAIEVGEATAEFRAWRGLARAALRFAPPAAAEPVLYGKDLDELLAELHWEECPRPLACRVRLWRGAVLVAARRGEAALPLLNPADADDDLRETLAVLRGVALLLLGREEEALALWTPVGVHDTRLLTRSWRALTLAQRPGFQSLVSLSEELKHLRKLGACDDVYHLAEAHFAFRANDDAEVPRSQDTAPLELAPLRAMVHAEFAFLAARHQMQVGEMVEAGAALDRLAPRRLWPVGARYWQAMALLNAERWANAETLLQPLADSGHADARAQLALFFARDGRLDDADQNAGRVLSEAQDHPFALLAKAEICEARGNQTEAVQAYQRVAERDPKLPGRRPAAAASLALGRLSEQAGDFTAALKWYQRATAARPDWPPASSRLGMLLALRGTGPKALAEAEAQTKSAARHAPENVLVALAQGVVAHRGGNANAAAEHLNRLIRLPDFPTLPPEVRRTVVLWGIDVHLNRKDYSAAAAALDRLSQEESSPDVEARLVHCRLLHAIQLLRQTPLSDCALAEALAALDAVRSRSPEHSQAVLLATVCRFLAGREEHEETRGLLDRIRTMTFDNERMRALAATAMLLGGDTTAAADTEALLQGPDGRSPALQALRLLAASQRRDVAVLSEAAEQILNGSHPLRSHLPFADDDLALLGALTKTKKLESAIAALDGWHEKRPGSPRTRIAHSQLLAKSAVLDLHAKKAGLARKNLGRAVAVLAGAKHTGD